MLNDYLMGYTEEEQAVTRWLRDKHGCKVEPYGQGIRPEWVRKAFYERDCILRYEPDLIVGLGKHLWLIDVKAGGKPDFIQEHTYYIVNRDVYQAQKRLQALYD